MKLSVTTQTTYAKSARPLHAKILRWIVFAVAAARRVRVGEARGEADGATERGGHGLGGKGRDVKRGTNKRGRWWLVDVGVCDVSWACCARGPNGGLVLEAWGIEPCGGVAGDDEAWSAGVSAALRKIDKARGETVYLGVPGHVAMTKWVRTPGIAGAKRAKVVEFEAAQNIPYPLSEVVWDYRALEEGGADLELMLAAAKAEVIERLCASVAGAGMTVVQVTPACVALWQCLRWSHPEAVAEGVLLVEVGMRSTHLVFAHGARFYARTLNQMSVSPDLPERLQTEIARTMANAERQGVGLEPRVILLGGASAAIESEAAMSALAGLRVERFEPLRRVELAARAVEQGASVVAGRLAGVVGLAVAASAGESRPNLLPAKFRRAATSGRWSRVAKAAAVVGLSVLMLAMWQLREATEAAKRQAEAIETQLAPLRAMERRVERGREEVERLKAEERRLRRVADGRTAWLRLMAELQEVLRSVDDVWRERLAGVESPSRTGGEEQNATALKVAVSGRMLDRARPAERANASSYEKVRRLLEELEAARSVAAVEHPRFDNSRAGILGFDVTLVMEASWFATTGDEEAGR